MRRLLPRIFVALTGFSLLAAGSASQQFERELDSLQHEWARINLELPDAAQAPAYALLARKAELIAARYPRKVEPRVWEGIIANSQLAAIAQPHRQESIPEMVARVCPVPARLGDDTSRG